MLQGRATTESQAPVLLLHFWSAASAPDSTSCNFTTVWGIYRRDSTKVQQYSEWRIGKALVVQGRGHSAVIGEHLHSFNLTAGQSDV